MAKVIARPPAGDLHEVDFPLWAERQAALLRAGQFDELDLDNLIEEGEDLRRRERRSVESHIETILEHFLKLAFSPAERGRPVTVDKQRAKLARELTATLRRHLEAELPALYAGLRRPVARELEKDHVPAHALPAACPCSLDQILDPDWYPDRRPGPAKPKP
ncbi:MAG TPA: DUF29 domain-containing protein [Geminicoccaceae bacterium]|nr:DUF29 domain-containing protein [Geminicoccaceae bacterium]